MPEQSEDEIKDSKVTRRDFIVLSATSMAVVGAACSLWPLVDSLNPAQNVLALSSVEVDLSTIKEGQTLTIKWRGKPVFIRNRTQQEVLEATNKSSGTIDPELDTNRVKKGHENWLVVIGTCTHLGCVPLSGKGDYGGWLCPCHGSQYDISGRVMRGPAPKNLVVPPYEFISDTKIKIG
jgi:ubiquinol-cytochrome c reductase iron-sulfur subunit